MPIHKSFIPKLIKITFQICQNPKTYKYYSTVWYNYIVSQNASCTFHSQNIFPRASCMSTALMCNIDSTDINTINGKCSNAVNQTTLYQCKIEKNHWLFYQGFPDFHSYAMLWLYLAFVVVLIVLAVGLNGTVLFLCFKSQVLRNTKGVISAAHMVFVDLLIGVLLLPIYFVLVLVGNHYLFTGKLLQSTQNHLVLNKAYGYLHIIFLSLSISNITMITVERCIAVVMAFWYLRASKIKRTLLTVPAVWFYCGFTVLVAFILRQSNNSKWVTFSMVFIIPSIVLMFSYTTILVSMRRKSNNRKKESQNGKDTIKKSIEFKLLLKLLILIIAFDFCWIPYYVYYLKIYDNRAYMRDISVRTGGRYAILLSYFHATFDAILYSLTKSVFRKEVNRMWKNHQPSLKVDHIKIRSTSGFSSALTTI